MNYKTKNQKNVINGRRNKMAGMNFEKEIEVAAVKYYEPRGIAKIEKTPEPVKQLGKMDQLGHFKACYEKHAQADFGGTLKGGRAIYFECKTTSTDRITQNAVSENQWLFLQEHQELGALCYVMVEFYQIGVYRIPFRVWENMKKIYGRKYLKHEDIKQYKCHELNGFLLFLSNLEEEEN